MNIGIDIDDTISNTIEKTLPVVIKYVKDELGKDISNIDYSNAVDHMYIETVFSMTRKESKRFWKKNLAYLVENVEIKDDVAQIINKLKEEGHRIIIITARWNEIGFNARKATKAWLENNNIQYDKLYVNINNKKEIAIKENLDLFIDDSIRNCREVSIANIRCYLFESAINKLIDEKNNFEIVKNWKEVYEKIKGGV